MLERDFFPSAVSPRRKICIGVVAVVVVVILIAIIAGSLSNRSTNPATNQATTFPLPQPQSLAQSNTQGNTQGLFYQLIRTDVTRPNSDENPVVARTYDGNPWEAVPDLNFPPVQINCISEANCVAYSSSGGTFQVEQVDVPSNLVNVSNTARFARLLSQATFGANRAYLQSTVATYQTNYTSWIQDQMKISPTLHRIYFRQRTSPRMDTANTVGTIYSPCEAGSRWHRFAFNIVDEGQTLVVSNTEIPNYFTFRVNGVLRGQVTTFLTFMPNTTNTTITFPAAYVICTVVESVNAQVTLAKTTTMVCNIPIPNPAIVFTSPDTTTTQILSSNQAKFAPVKSRPDSLILTQLLNTNCTLGEVDAFYGYNGQFYRYDPRLKFLQNTVDSPVNVVADATLQCPVVTKSFMNSQQSCVRRPSCVPLTYSATPITLNDTTLRSMYTVSNRYVYYIQGLRLEDPYSVSPCTGSSRWQRLGQMSCPAPTLGIDPVTMNALVGCLQNSTDTNPYIRDITCKANCTASAATIGAEIFAGGECFRHVHPDLYSVRDASYWTQMHDGNPTVFAAYGPNPIAKWAVEGLTYIYFPDSHPLSRWQQRSPLLNVIGRYGDVIQFSSLPSNIQTDALATLFGANPIRPAQFFEACGSIGEVANDPTLLLGNRYPLPDPSSQSPMLRELEWPFPLDTGKSHVWSNIMLTAPDQLRQRVAWALAQICTNSAVGGTLQNEIEPWANFFDIFVRNAFGNYRDVLKEVSYSPMMSFYLSYYQNQAYASSNSYPDENYAREVMQLFSVGLYLLNDDGSQMLDSYGNPISTYANEDIVDFARLWTGFNSPSQRSNIESINGASGPNVIDPLLIVPSWRDKLPKTKLLAAGFLGDTYPLCDSLPPLHWLTQGATYKLTGSTSVEGTTVDAQAPASAGYRGRFTPSSTSSALYKLLCASDSTGRCTFPDTVVLTQNLPCTWDAQECNAGRVIVATIIDPIANVTMYYTYVSVPCVRLTFFDQGKLTSSGSQYQCANPISNVAQPVCCTPSNPTRVISPNNSSLCVFGNEAMTYSTATTRCLNAGYGLCNGNYTGGATWTRTCADSQFQWLNASCTLQVQVYDTGQIAVVDPRINNSLFKALMASTNNVFRVMWNGGQFPSPLTGCSPSCKSVATSLGATCLCNLHVNESAVFTDPTTLPNATTLLSSLFIGAATPASFGSGVYAQCVTGACSGRTDVIVWTKTGSGWDESTIFQIGPLVAGGPNVYLANVLSTVTVDSFSFRNPPHFMPLAGEQTFTYVQWSSDQLWIARAQQEVEALLDHLFQHSNTAPFISYRLIQRLVTSNPSPRYVTAVTNAFRTGTYGGQTFSGTYGDLGATVAAILLDPEARSPTLEADPTFGKLREPIIKIMHLLRAMEYQSIDSRELMLPYINNFIGMEVYNSPTVFGFYLPDNSPDGLISDYGLVSPEAQIATSPNMVGYLNGIVSLIDNGLTSCSYGYGTTYNRSNCARPQLQADGALKYTPTPGLSQTDIINELDLVMTNGRTNPANLEYIIQRYTATLTATNDSTAALKVAQKLMIAIPEFHSTSANILKNTTRPKTTRANRSVPSQGRPYKAIVIIFQNGGCDSYSLLVPYANCAGTDLYAQYNNIRQASAAAQPPLLPISVPPNTQPCDTFAISGHMPTLQSLYNTKDALFLSNIGALVEPVSKADFFKTSGVTKQFPPSLFAHNMMQRSMHNLDPQNNAAKGILGRTVAALEDQAAPYASDLYSLMGTVTMLAGGPAPEFIDPYRGVTQFSEYAEFIEAYGNLTEFESHSVFSETYAAFLQSSLANSKALGADLATIKLNTTFGKDYLSQQFIQVSKLIKLRDTLQSERAVFVTTLGGYDTHQQFDLTNMFEPIDTALNSFKQEMQIQGMWDNVAILTVSEFARTLAPNGAGTDHGWGGNHMLVGGKVKGGQILGPYPSDLTDLGPSSVGRGRYVPSLPWEAVWKGLAQWFGAEDGQLAEILPNLENFPANMVFSATDLFDP